MQKGAITAIVTVAPGAALAHASERAVILTLPTGGLIWGAGLAVGLTALAASLGAALPAFTARRLFTRPALQPAGLASWLSAALFLALIFAGLLGTHDPYENPLPLMIWTVLWVGLTLVQAVLGDLWRHLNPWAGPVRSLRALLGRTGGIGLAGLGQWPAVLGLLGFAWLEIVSLSPDDPAQLAVLAGAYVLIIFVLAVLEGEDWLEQGEFLTAFFCLIARIAPFWTSDEGRRVTHWAGLPGTQVLALPPLSSSQIAFVTLVLASVSFDGLHETFAWVAAIGLNPLDYPGRSAVVAVNTAGLLAMWAVMAGLILAASVGVRAPVGLLCLSILPIAAGYHIAHYLTALLTQGQYAIAALSDPLARGDDLLGLGQHWVSFGFLSQSQTVWRIWMAQFALILGAHLIAVLLAEQGLRRAGLRPGLRAQLPMTFLMVLYTCFGLWLLASPAIG